MPTSPAATHAEPRTPAPAQQHWSAGVWAITLWTAGRAPLLTTLTSRGVGLSALGEQVHRHWQDLARVNPGVTLDQFAILPDRLRALLHVPWDRKAGAVGGVIARFKAALTRGLRQSGASVPQRLWEKGFEGYLVQGPDELAMWRRQIRAGQAGAYGWARGAGSAERSLAR